MAQKTENPFAIDNRPRGPRFGIGLLLLLMVVFAGVATALSYVMRVPAFTAELNAWLGRPTTATGDESDRTTQVIFVFFCYAAPLLMAMFVNIASMIFTRLGSRSGGSVGEADED